MPATSLKSPTHKRKRTSKTPQFIVEWENRQIKPAPMLAGLEMARLPAHSTTRSLRQAQVLQLQRVCGNACVQHIVAAEDYHRSPFYHGETTTLASSFRPGQQVVQLQLRPTPTTSRKVPTKRARRLFLWMEKPLQKVIKDPSWIDKWSDSAVSGLVLMYNKLRNENLWQYVAKLRDTSPRVSIDFYPTIRHSALKQQLAGHGYVDCMASWRIDWGLRKEKACGPHLHFKHFQSGDKWVNVHVDKVDPCCGRVPIIGPIISGLRHYHHDKRRWSRRHPDQFLKILTDQGVPLSTGVLKYLKRKGYLAP